MKTLIIALLLSSSVSMADIIQQPINYEAQEQKLKQQQIYIEQEMLREKQEANKVLKQQQIYTDHEMLREKQEANKLLKQQKQQVQELYQNSNQQTFDSDGNHNPVSGQ